MGRFTLKERSQGGREAHPPQPCHPERRTASRSERPGVEGSPVSRWGRRWCAGGSRVRKKDIGGPSTALRPPFRLRSAQDDSFWRGRSRVGRLSVRSLKDAVSDPSASGSEGQEWLFLATFEHSSVIDEHSSAIDERSFALAEHSSVTKERSFATAQHSSGPDQRSSETKERSSKARMGRFERKPDAEPTFSSASFPSLRLRGCWSQPLPPYGQPPASFLAPLESAVSFPSTLS